MMKFNEIKAHYKNALPEMKAEHSKTGNMWFDPYELDFFAEMTPIEMAVWQDIRSEPIPMYPQIPARQYFFDFANPFVKVAIECDGKKWHDPAKDAIRDANLKDDGWTIYRIPGRECLKLMDAPWEVERDMHERGYHGKDEIAEKVEPHASKWFSETSTGIINAINIAHFGRASKYQHVALQALEVRRS